MLFLNFEMRVSNKAAVHKVRRRWCSLIDLTLCKIRILIYKFRYVVFGNSSSIPGCVVERMRWDLAL